MASLSRKIFTNFLARILLGFSGITIAAGLVVILYVYLFGEGDPERAMFDMTPAIGQSAVSLLVYYLLFRALERRRLSEVSTRHLLRDIGLGLLVGAALQSATVGMIFLFGEASVDAVNPLSAMWPAAGMALGAAVMEELLFRGVLFRILNQRFGTVAALAVSGAVFGAVHLGNPDATALSAVMIAIEAGILLGAAYLYTGTLWLPIGIHFAWNFTQSGIFSADTSGMSLPAGLLATTLDGPDWLTGGAFGPEMSYQAVVFCLLAATLFLAGAVRRGHFVPAGGLKAAR